MFPADHVWNIPVDTLPLDANSGAYVATIGAGAPAHADFGTVYNSAPNGIPYATVPGTQAPVAVSFSYAGESDAGPYPIPPDAPIEGGPGSGGDRHVLIVDRDACKLYELFAAYPNANGSWSAGSGAVYDLRGYALRPDTWTSADAAGLPILPGLVRYDEVLAGEITHALRFTALRRRATPTCGPLATRRRRTAVRRTHPWVSASVSGPASTSPASVRSCRSSCGR